MLNYRILKLSRILILAMFTLGAILISSVYIFNCPAAQSVGINLNCLSPEVQKTLKSSERIYTAFKDKRQALVKFHPEQIDPWAPHTFPYDYFIATFTCPFSVQRVGSIGDGGKWVCGLELFKESPCVLYSFGISTETSFELEMLQSTNCQIFAFDASVESVYGIPQEFQNRINFSQKFLGTENSPEEFISLPSAMKINGHSHIDILKLDVEGKEFEIFDELVAQFGDNLPFSQLLIEIHANIIDGPSFAKLYRFFEKLENSGLRPFRNELNISPMILNKEYTNALSEYSFININSFCK